MKKEQVEITLKHYLNIPENWDKYDYEMPLFSFNSIVAVVCDLFNDKEQTKKLLEAVRDNDWATMLKVFPEGVEHRADTYNTVEQFDSWDSYDEYMCYTGPAQNLLKTKCLNYVLKGV